MADEEIPIEGGVGTGCFARGVGGIEATVFAVVAHSLDVFAGGNVGLGCHDAAVRVLGHAQRVGEFDPLDGVDIDRQIPAMNLFGFHAKKEGEKTGHHQALDVVGISVFHRLGDGLSEAMIGCVSGPEEAG